MAGPFGRFRCQECDREVSSLYRELCWTVAEPERGVRHQYAQLRRHKRPDGSPCPSDTSVILSTSLPRRKVGAR